MASSGTSSAVGYDGPVIDAFLHSPWLGGEDPSRPRGDRADWKSDPRLRRVMRAFAHESDGAEGGALDQAAVLAQMDKAGVAAALLVAKVYYRSTHDGVEALHDQLTELSNGSDGRLKAVGTIVPPEHGPASYWDVAQGARLVAETFAERGFVGVHITPSPWGLPPNDRWYYPLYAKCVELGLTVFTYVGMPGPLWPLTPNDPIHLDEVALAFPDLRIVAHHIGDPWTDTMVRLAAHHPNVYICTSAWSPKRYPAALMEFMRGRWHGVHGAAKVLFASDYPLLDLETAVRDARAMGLSTGQLEAALHGNARRLFWPELTGEL